MTLEVNPFGSPAGVVTSVNGQTGTVNLTAADVGAQPAFTEVTDLFTLSPTDITNKYVDLSAVPLVAANVKLVVSGQGGLIYGLDYQMTSDEGGKRLSWDALGLETELVSGDKLAATYLS